ncbi:MAG: galactose mutarotase [Clostridia bacterium]|nr:galactose mutarotase [Clostridia bacterium]
MSILTLQNDELCLEVDTTGACIKTLRFRGTEVGRDGITAGRYANRIAGAKLTIFFGEFKLDANENGNTLHGGTEGFDKKEWTVTDQSRDHVCMELISEDGDQGFPGTLKVKADYKIEGGAFKITYTAEADAPTVVNLTNHLYFNLNGGGPSGDHLLKIIADKVLEVDDQLIPTGNLLGVRGTRFDHKRQKRFRPDFDCCYALNGKGLRTVASLKGCESGINMEVETDQPGLQLYNTDTHICLETQHFPDSPHHPEFPDTTLLRGQIFKTRTIYSFRQEEK